MERVFSVDDILGTFWRLDAQPGEAAVAAAAAGTHSAPLTHQGSQMDLQKLYRDQSFTNAPPFQDMVHSTSFHRMNRSSSEWAFQEFLSKHTSPREVKQRGGIVDRAESDSHTSNSEDSGAEEDRERNHEEKATSVADGEDSEGEEEEEEGNTHEESTRPTEAGVPESETAVVSGVDRPTDKAVNRQPLNPESMVTGPLMQHHPYPYPYPHPLPHPHPDYFQPKNYGDRVPTETMMGPNSRSNYPPSNPHLEPQGHSLYSQAGDPKEYEEVLKQQLAAACAVVSNRVRAVGSTSGSILSRPTAVHPGAGPTALNSTPHGGSYLNGPHQSHSYFPSSLPFYDGSAGNLQGHSGHSCPPKIGMRPSGSAPPLSAVKLGLKPGLGGSKIEQASTTVSSREHSDDDDVRSDGEDELVASLEHVTDPEEIKRIKRMLSNRESARRSRRRKQAHLSDLEMQVAHLKAENSTLVKNLNEIGRKYSEAAVDNRVLKSDVEALRAKVKMAEEMIARSHHQQMAHYMYGPGGPGGYRPPTEQTSSHLPSQEVPYYPRPIRAGHMSPPPTHPSHQNQNGRMVGDRSGTPSPLPPHPYGAYPTSSPLPPPSHMYPHLLGGSHGHNQGMHPSQSVHPGQSVHPSQVVHPGHGAHMTGGVFQSRRSPTASPSNAGSGGLGESPSLAITGDRSPNVQRVPSGGGENQKKRGRGIDGKKIVKTGRIGHEEGRRGRAGSSENASEDGEDGVMDGGGS